MGVYGESCHSINSKRCHKIRVPKGMHFEILNTYYITPLYKIKGEACMCLYTFVSVCGARVKLGPGAVF